MSAETTWPKQAFTLGKVDKAGKIISDPSSSKTEMDEALAVMNSWRSAHTVPLQVILKTLRKPQIRWTPKLSSQND